ncbi:MAG: FapA family protein [Spirochaetota bacterium]
MRSDGHFELYYRHGWAYLAVHPPLDAGRPVYHEDVENRMRILGVPRVASQAIREVVERAEGTAVPLVEWPGGERLASVITCGVSDDEMSAWVEISAPHKGAAPPTPEDVLAVLEENGVAAGVDVDRVRALVRDQRYGERLTVAEGTRPVDARSARVVYHFDPYRGKPYLVMEFDRINLRELNFVENVHAGDLLAELEAPVKPRDGVTVLGRTLPASTEVERIALSAGANAELSADGTQIHATDDGNVRLVDGTVIVEPIVSVESVNYETGNIRFEGSVVVEKDVADGFVIEADGDVEVGRGVGKATIRAGGNVLLKAGVNGNGAARVECEGNVFAKYAEGATIVGHGNVFVEEAIMHCHLTAWRHCVLNGRRSEIIASNVVVGGSLWCKKLGSIAEAPTLVSIGVAPELLEAFRDARREVDAEERRLDEVHHGLEQIARALVDGHTDERFHETREQLLAESADLKTRLPDSRRRLHDLREKLQASRASRLVVEDTIYKGAVVLFGTAEFHAPEKGARKTVLRRGPEGIIEEGFNPADRPPMPFDGSEEAQAGGRRRSR